MTTALVAGVVLVVFGYFRSFLLRLVMRFLRGELRGMWHDFVESTDPPSSSASADDPEPPSLGQAPSKEDRTDLGPS